MEVAVWVWLAAQAFAVPLPRVIDEVLADELLIGASLGIVLIDEDGQVLYAHDPDRRLVPASVAKWATASAAIHHLGLDFTFATRIAVTGTTEGGTLQGDLVVIGGGDPSFGDEDWKGDVDRIVQTIRASGIERIDGSVVVDVRNGDGPPWGPGWMWDDLKESYSAPYGPVNFAHNLLQRGMSCEAQDGTGSPLLDPPTCLATTLRAALIQSDLPVTGAATTGIRYDAAEIGVIRSAPLWMLVHHLLVESDNLYAECVARALDRSTPATPAEARAQIDAVLAEAGIPDREVRLVDGSGLSRYSLVSARSLAQLTAWVRTQPWGTTLLAALPVAGRSGTLANRLVGTAGEGRVQAKTGSMSGVRNLVGWVEDQRGERYVVAFLMNGFLVAQSDAIAVQDRVLALVASSARGRIPRESEESAESDGG